MYVDLGDKPISFPLEFDGPLSLLTRAGTPNRPDDKTAREFNITAGAVLHLVLALRGGR
jgi:hypothetical protein